MKQDYVGPIINVTVFQTADVIRTSDNWGSDKENWEDWE